jgi:ABC transport system ATP-binding/permease protein
LTRLERQLTKLTEREALLHSQLADAATDYVKAAELDAQLRALHESRSQLEDEWLDAATRASR